MTGASKSEVIMGQPLGRRILHAAAKQLLARLTDPSVADGHPEAGRLSVERDDPLRTTMHPSKASEMAIESPFDEPEQLALHSPMDTANSGAFGFTLYNIQLIVSMLGTGSSIGGEYDISKFKYDTWVRLIDRDGNQFPIIVARRPNGVSVQIGNIAARAASSVRPTR